MRERFPFELGLEMDCFFLIAMAKRTEALLDGIARAGNRARESVSARSEPLTPPRCFDRTFPELICRAVAKSSLIEPCLQNHGFQSQGVCGGVTSLVVVEIKIDGFELCRPFFDLAGSSAQFFFAVAALIFAWIRTVEPNVGEVCGDVERRVVSS